MIIFLKKYYLW